MAAGPDPPGKAAMSWTDERVDTLKRMWGEGQSASAIAKELGGVTRNAVIGKVHRLGLSNRSDEAEAAPAAATPAPEPEKKVERKPAPAATATRAEPLADPGPAIAEAEPEEPATQAAFTPSPRRPVSPCRRNPRPTRSAPKPWPRSARSRRRPAS